MPKDAATLEAAGKAMFGAHWQGPLASELGINDRTLRRGLSDPASLPEGVWRDLGKLCRHHAETRRQEAEYLANLAANLGADFQSQVGEPRSFSPRR